MLKYYLKKFFAAFIVNFLLGIPLGILILMFPYHPILAELGLGVLIYFVAAGMFLLARTAYDILAYMIDYNEKNTDR